MGRKQTLKAAQKQSNQESVETGEYMADAKLKKRKSKREVTGGKHPEDKTGSELNVLARSNPSKNVSALELQQGHKKKKKKKAHIQCLEGEQKEFVNGDGQSHRYRQEVSGTSKRMRKSKITDKQYLNDLKEDGTDLYTPISHHSLFSAPLGHNKPLSKVSVERNDTFSEVDCVNLGHEQTEEFMEVRSMWNARDIAISVHSGFRIIGLFTHGFLAGYAVWNIIVVYVLAGEQLKSLTDLLQQYHKLAYPAQSLLYFLLAISTVSAFERVNLAKASMALKGFLTMDPAAIASFLYFAALILCLSQQMTSDRIHLYLVANKTLWPSGLEHQVLRPWIVVNLVISLLVGLAWIFICTRPDIDYTEEFLMAMEVEAYPRHESKAEILY